MPLSQAWPSVYSVFPLSLNHNFSRYLKNKTNNKKATCSLSTCLDFKTHFNSNVITLLLSFLLFPPVPLCTLINFQVASAYYISQNCVIFVSIGNDVPHPLITDLGSVVVLCNGFHLL